MSNISSLHLLPPTGVRVTRLFSCGRACCHGRLNILKNSSKIQKKSERLEKSCERGGISRSQEHFRQTFTQNYKSECFRESEWSDIFSFGRRLPAECYEELTCEKCTSACGINCGECMPFVEEAVDAIMLANTSLNSCYLPLRQFSGK